MTELKAAAVDQLTIQEKLLVAQAVYKLGAVAWPAVSSLLLEHPCCVDRPKALFAADACEGIYVELMTSIGINVPALDAMKPQAKVHLRLAQTFYLARMTELRDSIAHYETHFTSLMSEINAIKSGSLDTAIQAELRAVLARKYGKRLLDSWVPPSEDEVKAAVEAGRMDESEEKAVEDVEMAETREVEQTQLPSSARKPAVIVGPADQSEERQMEDAQTAEEQEVEASPVQTKRPSSARRVTVDHGLASKSGSRSMEQGQQSKGEELSREQSKRSPSAPASELSPPPSVAITHSPSIHEEPSTRTSKRKASRPPRDAPKTKRSGKRAVSAVPTQPEIEIASEAGDPEPEAEVEPDAEESVPPALGRRASRRGRPKKALQSPTASTRTKESSPAVSRRAPSVSSTTSATPLGSARRGKGRGMRDEVVSKIVREQSAAASVKEEAEDDAAEGVTRRSGRRAKAELEEKKENLAEKRNRKGKRGSLQTPVDPEGDDATTAKRDRSSSVRASRPIAQRLISTLLDSISSHRNGNIFQNPVRKSEAADYYEVIKRPMDLKTIRSRIRDGQIANIDDFERDILLMFANAMMYNTEGSQVFTMAQEMLRESEHQIAHYRSLQHDMGR